MVLRQPSTTASTPNRHQNVVHGRFIFSGHLHPYVDTKLKNAAHSVIGRLNASYNTPRSCSLAVVYEPRTVRSVVDRLTNQPRPSPPVLRTSTISSHRHRL
ncbi:unnamed protein product, partial [Ectocarpus sp. 12 AP-2014]